MQFWISGIDQPTLKPETPFPTRTNTSGQRGGQPTGSRTTVKENDVNQESIRGIIRENESAEILANSGYNIHQNPQLRSLNAPNKNPDYLIEGRVFDNYAPSSGDVSHIMGTISNKVSSGQAPRIVLNLADVPANVNRHNLREFINANPISGLQEIIVIDRNRNVIRFYP